MNHYLKKKIDTLKTIRRNRIPGQLVIQMTDRCNARCPQCGMRVTENFSRSTLDADYMRRLIDAAAEKKFQAVSFTGGEPLLVADKLIPLIHYAGKAGIPYIRTGTNGFIFKYSGQPGFEARISRFAEALAETPLRNFWISIDSCFDPVHEHMRGFKGIIAGIEKALPIFHQAGIFPSANLGINRNLSGTWTQSIQRNRFDSQEAYLQAFSDAFYEGYHRFYRRVVYMGFTMANTCYPMSIDEEEESMGLSPVYAASAVENIVRFSADEKVLLFKRLMRAVMHWRKKIRIFSPLCAMDALILQHAGQKNGHQPNGCRGGIDFFFVDAGDGNTYPCGYRGNENLGKLWEINMARLKKRIDSDMCVRCDWECFRDPTELLNPVLQAFTTPGGQLKKLLKRDESIKLWLQDILYYHACDYFNGRKPPDYTRLQAISKLSSSPWLSTVGLQSSHQPEEDNGSI
jgi:MoaA/NifB/PqqE/SkfB family radical SAM enzyme